MKSMLIVGSMVEAVGLALTALGLWRTWKANTGQPLPWLWQCADFVLYKVLRRKRTPVTLRPHGSAISHAAWTGFLYGHQPLTDGMTVDQKIDAVQANALAAIESAAHAYEAAGKEQREREQALKGLEQRLSGSEEELRTYAKRLVVDGIPLAIGGLAVAGLGLLIQTVGTWLS